MKSLHRPDLFSWAAFDEPRNIDFNGHLWLSGGRGIAIDPMPVSPHDVAHIDELGGVGWVLLTNADHVRAAGFFADRWGARIAAPAAERSLPGLQGLAVAHWIERGEVLPCGIRCLVMEGSKTPGELAFLLPGGDVVICGDLVRGQRAGSLNLLPDAKLADRAAARRSVAGLAALPDLVAVLVGDGQSIFREGRARLNELLETTK